MSSEIASERPKAEEKGIGDIDSKEDWEIQRDHHKSLADSAFRSADYKTAIQEYTNAITFDPEFHILYSNRSAAHLHLSEKSKALADAKKCVSLKPDFVKGHSRLASSMLSLGRWNEARSVYNHILKSLDKENAVAKKGLEDCRERELKAKAAELEMIRLAQEAKEKEEGAKDQIQSEKSEVSDAAGEEDDLLNDFFKDVEKKPPVKEETGEEDDLLNDFFDDVETKPPPSKKQDEGKDNAKPPAENKIQIQMNDLGDTQKQIERLLRRNHEWFNLNPFRVLDISHQAPLDLISRRYKALSLLLHPDKVRNSKNAHLAEQAEEAFEYVRKAMTSLKDEDKAKHYRDLVQEGMKIGKRDHSTSVGDDDLESFQDKAVTKIFAEIERKRRDVERRKRNQEKREREQEDAEVDKIKKERNFEKNWKDNNRVEKRIGNWRDFAAEKKKKSKY